MKKLNKNIAISVVIGMTVSSFAPTAQAYSLSQNKGSEVFKNLKRVKIMGDVFTVQEKKTELQADDTELEFQIRVIKGTPNNKIGVQILNEKNPVEIKNLSITGDESKQLRTIKFNVPENNSSDDKKYEIRFCVDKDNPDYESSPLANVLHKSKETKNDIQEKEAIKEENPESNEPDMGKEENPKQEEINNATIKGVFPRANFIDSNEHTTKFKLLTDKNISNENIISEVKCNDKLIDLKVNITGSGEEREASVDIPQNKEKSNKIYTIKLTDNKNKEYYTIFTINQDLDKTIPMIQNIISTYEGIKIKSEGEKITFRVNAPNVDKDKLGVKVTSDNETIEINDLEISGKKSVKTISMSLPKNAVQEPKKYKIEFCIDKNKPNYKNNPYLEINQEASKTQKKSQITSFEITKADLPKEGGMTTVTTKGTNLESERLSLKIEKILKDGNKRDVTDTISGKENVFSGSENLMSTNLKFPKITNVDDTDTYEVTLLMDKKEISKNKVTVSKYGTLADTTSFGLSGVYMDGNNKIILECEENLYEIIPGSLRDNISIKISTKEKLKDIEKVDEDGKLKDTEVSNEGEFVKLSKDDKVDIQNNFIIITLKNPIDIEKMDVAKSKVRIEKRVLKNSEGLPFAELEQYINKDIPVVHEYEFEKGEILDSKGGEVAIKLKGINLINPQNIELKDSTKKVTRVKVFKKENLQDNIKYLDGVKVEGEGKEQTIRFNLPANKGNRTESYTVMISLDNGKTYSPEVGVNMLDSRGTRITPSVLPEGKTDKDATLAFASIQSYGTSGGGEAPDNTHTNTPTNQESKKTFVHLYGTNLEKNKTKVRIINDKTGVVFVPTNEPAKDSGDRFIMVGFDGTGIIGDGNHQQLEIIAPRGYRGDNRWTYQFAIDGVHFDKEMTVSSTVLDDNEDGGVRKNPSDIARDLTVRYITTDGKEIAKQENHRVFKGQQLYSSDIRHKEIEGYKYLGVKELNEAKYRLDNLNTKDNKKLTESEKLEKANLENLFNHVVNHKFKELEMCYDNKPGEKGVLTFIYEDLSNSKNTSNSKSNKSNLNNKSNISDRISGSNRYDTAIKLSKKAYSSSEKVYLVSGEKFPDALSSAALTGKGDGPILLINDKNIEKVLSEIERLGAKEVVFVGGNSISNDNKTKVRKFVDKKSTTISEFVGKNRYETAIKVAEETIKKLGNKGKVIIADGRNYPDAVSIAPYASKEGIPVILVNGNNISREAKDFLNKHKIKDAIIVGGNKAVGKDVEKLFNNVDRIAGKDRYETSKKIADKLFEDSNTVFIASGESFADSLSVSYYAGIKHAPVLITKSNSLHKSTKEYLNNNKNKKYIIIGGDKAVDSKIFK